MPLIGWVFILLAAALVVGSLLMLKDSANMPLSDEKREKIRKRQAELEAEEEKERRDDLLFILHQKGLHVAGLFGIRLRS